MSDTSHLESRIAVLEEQIKYLGADNDELKNDLLNVYKDIKRHMDDEEEKQEALLSAINDLREKIYDINKEITHYKGVIGGMILTVSAIFTALGLAWKFLVN